MRTLQRSPNCLSPPAPPQRAGMDNSMWEVLRMLVIDTIVHCWCISSALTAKSSHSLQLIREAPRVMQSSSLNNWACSPPTLSPFPWESTHHFPVLLAPEFHYLLPACAWVPGSRSSSIIFWTKLGAKESKEIHAKGQKKMEHGPQLIREQAFHVTSFKAKEKKGEEGMYKYLTAVSTKTIILPDLKGAYNVGRGEICIFTSEPDLILISFCHLWTVPQRLVREEPLIKPLKVSDKNSRQSKLWIIPRNPSGPSSTGFCAE